MILHKTPQILKVCNKGQLKILILTITKFYDLVHLSVLLVFAKELVKDIVLLILKTV